MILKLKIKKMCPNQPLDQNVFFKSFRYNYNFEYIYCLRLYLCPWQRKVPKGKLTTWKTNNYTRNCCLGTWSFIYQRGSTSSTGSSIHQKKLCCSSKLRPRNFTFSQILVQDYFVQRQNKVKLFYKNYFCCANKLLVHKYRFYRF